MKIYPKTSASIELNRTIKYVYEIVNLGSLATSWLSLYMTIDTLNCNLQVETSRVAMRHLHFSLQSRFE